MVKSLPLHQSLIIQNLLAPSLKELQICNCTRLHHLISCYDMASFYAEIEINAPKAKVWQVLFQKQQWHKWNTFLFDLDSNAPFKQGQEVFLSLRRYPGEEETEFQPTVTLVQSGTCLAWVSSIPGFQNEYIFELQEIGVGRTKYVHRDNFSGLLTRVFLPFIREDEQQGIKRMARELKRYVEQM